MQPFLETPVRPGRPSLHVTVERGGLAVGLPPPEAPCPFTIRRRLGGGEGERVGTRTWPLSAACFRRDTGAAAGCGAGLGDLRLGDPSLFGLPSGLPPSGLPAGLPPRTRSRTARSAGDRGLTVTDRETSSDQLCCLLAELPGVTTHVGRLGGQVPGGVVFVPRASLSVEVPSVEEGVPPPLGLISGHHDQTLFDLRRADTRVPPLDPLGSCRTSVRSTRGRMSSCGAASKATWGSFCGSLL